MEKKNPRALLKEAERFARQARSGHPKPSEKKPLRSRLPKDKPGPKLNKLGQDLLDQYDGKSLDPIIEEKLGYLRICRSIIKSKVLEARGDPNKFIEYCFDDDVTGEPVKQQDFHREIQNAMTDFSVKDLVAMVARDHGKCVAKGTGIHLADGTIIAVENFSDGDVLALDVDTWRISGAGAKCASNGIRECVEVETRSGRTITVSGNHPFLTGRGYTRADELQIGDRVGVILGRNPDPTACSLDPSEAYAIGMLVGDGGLTNHSVRFSSVEEYTIERMRLWANARGWTVKPIGGTTCDYSVTWIGGKRSGGPSHRLRDLGLMGESSHTKRVPTEIFRCNPSSQRAFLAGYFDADGTANVLGGGSAEFYSVNRDLLRDVQEMLSSYGVAAILSPKRGRYNGSVHMSWRLTIRGDSMAIFARLNLSMSTKAKLLRTVVKNTKGNGFGGGSKLDLVPCEVWKRCVKSSGAELRRRGIRIDVRLGMSKAKVLRLACADDNQSLRAIAEGHVMWDSVTRIEAVGERETFDLCVPGRGNFVAEGFITHNTTQLEANVLFSLGNNPNLRTKIVCESDNRAVERLFSIMQHMRNNDRVKAVFPHLKPAQWGDWTKHKLVVERSRIMRDASVEALGILSTATGGRADKLYADDAVGRRNAIEQPKLRETVKAAWDSDWSNLLEPHGETVWICTPWHIKDCTHKLVANPIYHVIRYPVGNESNPCHALWPEKWTEESLRYRRRKIGEMEFNRGFRLVALSGEYATVRPEWITYWGENEGPDLDKLQIFIAFDVSSGESTDYFAAVVVGVDPETMTIYVLDAWHDKLSFLSRARSVMREGRRWTPNVMGIEKSSMNSLKQYLDEATLLSTLPLRPTLSKRVRLMGITPPLEEGRVIFNPALDPENITDKEKHGDLVGELKDFPLGANDDLVDSFVYAVMLAMTYGGDDDEDMEEGGDVGVDMIGGDNEEADLEDLFNVV